MGHDSMWDPRNLASGGMYGANIDAERAQDAADRKLAAERAAELKKVHDADRITQQKFISSIRNQSRGGGGNTLG